MGYAGPVTALKHTVCEGCRDGAAFDVPFTMAFQPIVDVEARSVFAFEALIRGPNAEPAYTILSQVNERNRYGFDQACRVRAIELAARLGLPATGAMLSINFLPNAVYKPEACIRATLKAAERVGFPLDRLLFELTENEQLTDHDHLKSIVDSYRQMGFRTAIDDFGAGFSGLNLLVKFQPDIIKLDMELIRGLDADPVRRSIVRAIMGICADLGITAIAEGVETEAEMRALRDCGLRLFQGYLFARPGFETLPAPLLP